MKSKYFVFLVLLTSITYGICDYQNNSIPYAINQIFKAIETRNSEKWDQFVAEETLINNIFVNQKESLKVDPEEELSIKVNKYFNQMKSFVFDEGLKGDVDVYINNYFQGTREQILNLEEISFLDSFVVNADLHMFKILKVKKEETFAMAEVSVNNLLYKKEFILKLLFKKEKNWKLISVINSNDIILLMKEYEKERRNAAISKKTEKMQKILLIKEYTGLRKEMWFNDLPILNYIPLFKSRHTFKLQNVSNQNILEFKIKMTFKNIDGWITVEKKLAKRGLLEHGKETEIILDLYNPIVLSQMELNRFPEINHVYIKMESGEKIFNEENLNTIFYENPNF